jgi:hypothetical protein
LVPILITAVREPFQFFLRDGNHNATQLFGVVRLPRFRSKGLVVARDQRRARRHLDGRNNRWRGVALAGKQVCGNG